MKRLALAGLLVLAACGAKGPLQWPEGGPPSPPPGLAAPLSSDAMLEVPPAAAPDRVDDPVRRSQERGDDAFDLPPTAR
jgi:predicted small lipoprotein YifL